ncbi:MAG: response regulator transcription factor [Aquitalea sp.]|nr:response regulator transcription factor [Aquitalea sp.]
MGAVSRLRVLVVDDEPLARERMVALVAQCGATTVAALGDASAAIDWLARQAADVVLLDISMPGLSGIELGRRLQQHPLPPQLIFTTAHENHAIDAFELDAVDYLLKPVRLERLRQALDKAARRSGAMPVIEAYFTVRHRDSLLHIPFSAVRYLKAEQKYVSLVTAEGEYLLDESLVALEQRLGDSVLRIHRNCLVMRHAVQELLRTGSGDEEQWAVRLQGIAQPLAVSRRQLPSLRASLRQPAMR